MAEILVSCLAPVVIHFLLALSYVAVMLPYSVPLTVIGLLTVALQLILAGIREQKAGRSCQNPDTGRGKIAGDDGYRYRDDGKSAFSRSRRTVSGTVVRDAGRGKSRAGFSRLYEQFFQQGSGTFTGNQQYGGALFWCPAGDGQFFTAGMVLLTFQGLLLSFYRPVQSLVESGQKLHETRSSMELIGDVMNYEEIERRDCRREGGLSKRAAK